MNLSTKDFSRKGQGRCAREEKATAENIILILPVYPLCFLFAGAPLHGALTQLGCNHLGEREHWSTATVSSLMSNPVYHFNVTIILIQRKQRPQGYKEISLGHINECILSSAGQEVFFRLLRSSQP